MQIQWIQILHFCTENTTWLVQSNFPLSVKDGGPDEKLSCKN